MEELDRWFRDGLGWWLLVGGVAAWVAYGWVRRTWRRWAAKRRRRAFDLREERRWQAHRRERGEITQIKK